MKKALVAALCVMLVGFMMVNGTLADLLNDASEIFVDFANSLGKATVDSQFDVDLVNVGKIEQLYPGGTATHTVRVDNKCSLGACFRLAFAVQNTSAWNQLDFAFAAGTGFQEEGDWRDITIGGVAYKMKIFTYTETLAANSQSPTVSIAITMDKTVTSAQIEEFQADFLKTQVLAIEADVFLSANKDAKSTPLYDTPIAALNAALPLDNFNPFK